MSLYLELDIASQGSAIQEARENLKETIELFSKTSSKEEIHTRLHDQIYITQVEVAFD